MTPQLSSHDMRFCFSLIDRLIFEGVEVDDDLLTRAAELRDLEITGREAAEIIIAKRAQFSESTK